MSSGQDSTRQHTVLPPREEGKAATVEAHLQDMGTQVKEMAKDLGAQVKETVQGMGTQVKETMTEYYEQGRESLREVPPTLEAQIRARPLQALLVAGGIGALLALLTRRS